MRRELKEIKPITVEIIESSKDTDPPKLIIEDNPQEEIIEVQSSRKAIKVTKASGNGVVANCYALHVRNGGTAKHKVLGYLAKGDKVTVTGVCDTKWYRIKFKGGVGYVSNKYISGKIKKEDAKKPPTNNSKDTTTSNSADLPYLVKELSTLKGEARILPNFKVKPRDIVEFKGLGSKLSGKYYVQDVKINISDSGFEQTLTVTKNAFG